MILYVRETKCKHFMKSSYEVAKFDLAAEGVKKFFADVEAPAMAFPRPF